MKIRILSRSDIERAVGAAAAVEQTGGDAVPWATDTHIGTQRT